MKNSSATLWQTISATFLIAGTCIGGGMLALPITTGVAGFIPSIAVMLICWAYMCATGLLIAEATFWMKDENAHMSSICTHFLGNPGRVLSWIIYLFIGYASLIAYVDGAGKIVNVAIAEIFPSLEFSPYIGPAAFALLFGAILILGGKVIESLNALLFIGLLAAYAGILAFGFHGVNPSYLMLQAWKESLLSTPILLTIFSYQAIVPSIPNLLNRDPKAVKTSIIAGTILAFLVYLAWEFILLGTVPIDGPKGLLNAFQEAIPATEILRVNSNSHTLLSYFAGFFSFFAIVTSFLGIALGLFDFLSDGLKVPKKGLGVLFLAALVIIPSFLVSISFKRIFLIALDTSGGFGDSILNGIIPALIIWKGRYLLQKKSLMGFSGMKIILLLIMAFSLVTISLEIFSLLK